MENFDSQSLKALLEDPTELKKAVDEKQLLQSCCLLEDKNLDTNWTKFVVLFHLFKKTDIIEHKHLNRIPPFLHLFSPLENALRNPVIKNPKHSQHFAARAVVRLLLEHKDIKIDYTAITEAMMTPCPDIFEFMVTSPAREGHSEPKEIELDGLNQNTNAELEVCAPNLVIAAQHCEYINIMNLVTSVCSIPESPVPLLSNLLQVPRVSSHIGAIIEGLMISALYDHAHALKVLVRHMIEQGFQHMLFERHFNVSFQDFAHSRFDYLDHYPDEGDATCYHVPLDTYLAISASRRCILALNELLPKFVNFNRKKCLPDPELADYTPLELLMMHHGKHHEPKRLTGTMEALCSIEGVKLPRKMSPEELRGFSTLPSHISKIWERILGDDESAPYIDRYDGEVVKDEDEEVEFDRVANAIHRFPHLWGPMEHSRFRRLSRMFWPCYETDSFYGPVRAMFERRKQAVERHVMVELCIEGYLVANNESKNFKSYVSILSRLPLEMRMLVTVGGKFERKEIPKASILLKNFE